MPAIRDAVRNHHAPTGNETDPILAAIVHVADVICHRLFGGPPGSKPRTFFSASALHHARTATPEWHVGRRPVWTPCRNGSCTVLRLWN